MEPQAFVTKALARSFVLHDLCRTARARATGSNTHDVANAASSLEGALALALEGTLPVVTLAEIIGRQVLVLRMFLVHGDIARAKRDNELLDLQRVYL